MHRHGWFRRFLVSLALLGVATFPFPEDARRSAAPHGATGRSADAATRRLVLEAYGRLPLHFEANQGQTDPSVQFLARGQGYTLFLTATEAVLALRSSPQAGAAQQTVVRLGLAGANPTPEVVGEAALPGRVNYFAGNDPSRWRTEIPTYGRVRYAHVYPGIALVYYGKQGALEYDFEVEPGADPGAIVLTVAGAERVEVDAQGDLILQVAGGEIRQRKPVIYQEAEGRRVEIPGGYVLLGRDRVGFRVEAYDATRRLVIDPVLAYSTYLGGGGADEVYGIAVDGAGNAYLTGSTGSTDFPTTAGAYDTTFNGGNYDVFVTKLNAAGTALVYSTYLGGSFDDLCYGIAVDGAGNAYLTGATYSTDFPTTAGAYDPTANGVWDVFVTKLNAAGSALVYSTYLGDSAWDIGYGIAVDGAGTAYVRGTTNSANFPTTAGAFDTMANGDWDVFVTKLNAAGSALVYSTYLGGSGFDEGYGIAVDGAGNAYVAGYTASTNFPTTAGAFDTTANGVWDVFVTKLNAAGSALVYSTYLGGRSLDIGWGIAVDGAGNAYVAGSTASTNFPTTTGAFDTTANGDWDVFVAKVNAAGSALVYSTYLGGSGGEDGNGIAVDGAGTAYVTGATTSTNFPTTPGAYDTTANGAVDVFVAKVNAAGSALVYSTYLGGSDTDRGLGLAVDGAGNAYVMGITNSANFPTTAGAYDTTANGGWDVFVTRFSPDVTVGLHNPTTSTFYLRNSNTAGVADLTFGYGPAGAGWLPVVGDWDGNGTDTVGLYNPATSTFFLRNSNTAGVADLTFGYGPAGAGWIPVVGDWDGNGTDTVGLYNPATSTFFLRNSNTAGVADLTFGYGPAGAGWLPVVGDWDGNGTDTVGLYNPATSTFFLRNSNTAGVADLTFGYGPAASGWIPVVGDWDGNRTDTVGLYNPATSTFFLRNSNTAGVADLTFGYGPAGAGWFPRVGDWDWGRP